jgi:hypothetical protein
MSALITFVKAFRALDAAICEHCAEPAFHDFATALGAAADDLEAAARAECSGSDGQPAPPPPKTSSRPRASRASRGHP